MNTSPDLWLFAALVFGVVLLPGLDMAFVAASALGGGRRSGLAAVAGIVAAGQVHVAAGASGVAALLLWWPGVRPALLLAGAAYVGWIGWGLLRASGAGSPAPAVAAKDRGRTFWRAAATGLSNPKAYAFTLAVMPPFLAAPARSLAVQVLCLAGLVALNQALVYGAVAWLAAGARPWIERDARARRWTTRATGALLLAAAAATAAGAAHAQPTAEAARRPTMTDASHDFDFLVGRWRGDNRKLRQPLSGQPPEWERFETELEVVRLPDGTNNADRFSAPAWRPGYVGSTLRVFNPKTGLWCLYSFDSRGNGFDGAGGALVAPVIGRFEGDSGVFEGDDEFEGRPIRVRYRWQRLGPDRARWEQSFSADGGGRSELNWTVEQRRERAAAGTQ